MERERSPTEIPFLVSVRADEVEETTASPAFATRLDQSSNLNVSTADKSVSILKRSKSNIDKNQTAAANINFDDKNQTAATNVNFDDMFSTGDSSKLKFRGQLHPVVAGTTKSDPPPSAVMSRRVSVQGQEKILEKRLSYSQKRNSNGNGEGDQFLKNSVRQRDPSSESLQSDDDEHSGAPAGKLQRTVSKGSSVSSLGNKLHPILQWLQNIKESIMKSKAFKVTIAYLAADRTKILLCLLVMIIMHTAVATVFIISLSVIMPGIWVYNFMQLFVITAALIAHEAATRLSNMVRTSITAGDLLKGRITISQLADYWVKGPKAPAQKIILTSLYVEAVADLILIASSICFSWQSIQTKIMTNQCIPPSYVGSVLPPGIDIQNYVQGDIDFAEVYNYGLPLADGLIGGWPGWPMANPMSSFQINGQGPVYVMQVLCDNGVAHPDLDPGIYTQSNIRFLSEDSRGFMLQISITFPPTSVFDDIFQIVHNTTFVQDCTVMMIIAEGYMTYHFVADQWQMVTNGQIMSLHSPSKEFSSMYPTSIYQYATDAHLAFENYEDTFGVLPILKESVSLLFTNASFAPSQGALFCNMFSEATWPDGYYHTETTYRGVAVGLGAAAHFAIMQYDANATLANCDYYGYSGSGILAIPQTAIYLSVTGSAIAILIKCFEIMWWSMAQSSIEHDSYRRARRALRHPLRFAIDASEMLASGMAAGENGEDICDVTTTRAIEELGNARIMYGEDNLTRDMDAGHLRIAEYGRVKSIQKDRKYGTYKRSQHPEWEEYLDN